MTIIGVTGHRPKHMPHKKPYSKENMWAVTHVIRKHLIVSKPSLLLVGGALGFDQWSAITALQMKIPYKLILPFPDMDVMWPDYSRRTFAEIVKHASDIVYFSMDSKAAVPKLMARNEMIVNQSTEIMALWNWELPRTGTSSTVAFARKMGKTIHNLWPAYVEELNKRSHPSLMNSHSENPYDDHQ